MSDLWSSAQETEYQRMLQHIEFCQSCELVNHDNSASTCTDMDSVLASLGAAAVEPVS